MQRKNKIDYFCSFMNENRTIINVHTAEIILNELKTK